MIETPFKNDNVLISISDADEEDGIFEITLWSSVEITSPYTRGLSPRDVPKTSTKYGAPSKLLREGDWFTNKKKAIDHGKRLAKSLVASGFAEQVDVEFDFMPIAIYTPTTPFNVKERRL